MNLLYFCQGRLIACAFFKIPGSVHIIQMTDWWQIYNKLKGVYETIRGKCTIDSAFRICGHQFLTKYSQTCVDTLQEEITNQQAASMH